jgi:UDP-N-acetylglucosamine 2-epimerase (non-hydrolysing)
MKIISVVGARPNFMKISPILEALKAYPVESLLVHTGQHYDYELSQVFFDQLGIPNTNYHLGAGSGSHAEQTARIMTAFEEVLIKEKPDLVIVVGDVNSTLACALTASKLNIKVAHVEAGIRCFDKSMPEEINRILTDHISDYLLAPTEVAAGNLIKEGLSDVYVVGDVMIDTLVKFKPRAEGYADAIMSEYRLDNANYGLLTMHRPQNVDNEDMLRGWLSIIDSLGHTIAMPCHPRTLAKLKQFGITEELAFSNIRLLPPLGYIEFLSLMVNSKFVITDSGGIQEETTYLNIPCFTLRPNTERPETVTEGTNCLVKSPSELHYWFGINFDKKGKAPFIWDGHASERIVKILCQ